MYIRMEEKMPKAKLAYAERVIYHSDLSISYYLINEYYMAQFERGCAWFYIGFGGLTEL